MQYSDLRISETIKIEILPSDRFDSHNDVFIKGDTLYTIFRQVGTQFVADELHNGIFLKEVIHRFTYAENHDLVKALKSTIAACNYSFLCPPADLELRPESGVMVLVVYIDDKKNMTFSQLGNIILKQKINGRYTALTQDHTFCNPLEVARLRIAYQNLVGTKKDNMSSEIKKIADKIAVSSKSVPSRFLGHPSFNALASDGNYMIISHEPYIYSSG
jgi:hypothetical protein